MAEQLLFLTGGAGGGVAVHLGTGALVRFLVRAPATTAPARWDVVAAHEVDDDRLRFAPDCLVVDRLQPAGHLRGRAAERLLRPLVHPPSRPLLGSAGFSVPFWTMGPDQHSVALVEPVAGPVIERRTGGALRCRFRWRRLDHDLPLEDPALLVALDHPTCDRVGGGTLRRALGWRPHRLVVALTPPRHGQCHKVVAALLPHP